MLDFSELPKDGILFEQLIREILVREGFEVHWTGVGNDGGRDLIFFERAKGHLSTFEKKWIVSCKHSMTGKTIGQDDTNFSSLRDACESADATGILLAVSTQLSSSGLKRIEDFNNKHDIDIIYWDGIEIENRLNKPHCYSLIHTFFPKSSRSFGWKIIESSKPFMWIGFYKNYCLYLCARSSFSFTLLKNVEYITGEIEKIELPRMRPENDKIVIGDLILPYPRVQFLRPRAFYFDSKTSNLWVYIDYLVDHSADYEKILKPKELKRYLSKITDIKDIYIIWDIKFVEANFSSDHFNVDHKDYYYRDIEKFRSRGQRVYSLDSINSWEEQYLFDY
ncbi:restriction endonuclease [Paenibacillus nitricinens]|uniref:restriction endonuclease n=1 Tax=Paenibacillus nitricinens TaxID=3367691 RepID=UPI003F838120